ncbi:dihydrolipoamide acetyltransferase family protein [Gulosibacter sp. GYB002]|uniref:dihydrolipoamide acetyltransferase family protein n=1 Tax=Gulosibacter sp. GYB002 TaxID=2994391 RepID=UPI002F96CD6F
MLVREFLLPDLGEGLTEAKIVEWKIGVGDAVEIDQPIVDVESAKAVVELPVPFAGIIESLCGEPGDTIELGDVLVRVRQISPDGSEAELPATQPDAGREAAEQLADADPADAESSEYSGAVLTGYGLHESKVRLRRPEGGRFRNRGAAAAVSSAATMPQDASKLLDSTRNSPVMSPLVRREAKAAGFDARHLAGSGRGGLVLRADVRAAIEQLGDTATVVPARDQRPSGQSCAAGAGDRRMPLDGMRQLVAEHMVESHSTVPKATIWLDVDATPLLELRQQLQTATDERFSLTTLIARIVVAALREHPRLNSSFDSREGVIVEHSAINLGLAAQTPRGLMVPVLHGVEGYTLRELRDAVGELVAESKRGNFSPAQLSGGTFTLNNYGGFGVDGASPIINLPQTAMLGLGRLKERPWVVDGELAVRRVMTVSFVFDHRVCDGDAASAFLTYVTDRIENPVLLHTDL